MRNINIAVVPKNGDSRIPVDVAGNVMVDVQSMFRHIGEYLITAELKLQNKVGSGLSDLFGLFVDQSMGISLRSSTKISTSGIIDGALALLEKTIIKLGSGAGGYWIDDTFADPRFRKLIADDIIRLAQDVGTEHSLRIGKDSFDNVDVAKMKTYANYLKMTYDGAACGVPKRDLRSKRAEGMVLAIGDDRVKMSFNSKTQASGDIEKLMNKAAVVRGTVRMSDGRISELSDVTKVIPFELVKFNRMISADGDVSLTVPLEVRVEFDAKEEMWVLKNDEIGANVSKKDWDSAVTSFHDYFVFLWNEYAAKEAKGLSEEEKEVRDFLLGLVVTK